jgi:glutamate carboxypeptidase
MTARNDATADALADRAGAVLSWLQAEQAAMVALLMELARLESPTDDPAAVAPVLTRLEAELRAAGMLVRRLRGQRTGGVIVARPARRIRHRPLQLVVGHCDTVWPVGTMRSMPVDVVGDEIRGPGVFDMKAGLVQLLFALRALRALDIDPPVTPIVLFTSDEETGSSESMRTTIRLARRVARAFVLEPAFGPTGRLKTARKAVGEFEIVIQGKAAHAGLSPTEGVSAILELSHQIQQLFALNDPGHGITVNVGTIDGGVRPNVVAAEVRARVDVRAPSRADAERLERAIRGLQPVDPKTAIHVSGGFQHPPLEPLPRNQALWHIAEHAGRSLGLELEQASVGGASDGNTISQFTATLDGLGAVGDGAHAAHEHALISALPSRAALLVLLLASPLEHPLSATGTPDSTGSGLAHPERGAR